MTDERKLARPLSALLEKDSKELDRLLAEVEWEPIPDRLLMLAKQLEDALAERRAALGDPELPRPRKLH